MILSTNVFNKIKRLEKNNTYNYTLLSFSSNNIELIYSDINDKDLSKLIDFFPLIVIRDKKKSDNYKSTVIDNVINSVISKRVEDEKIYLVKKYLNNITYEKFIDEKNNIIKVINNIILSVNIVNKFEKDLDDNYFSKSNIRTFNKNQKELEASIGFTTKSQKYKKALSNEVSKKITQQKRNINDRIKNYDFLKPFFFENMEDDTYEIIHPTNTFSKNDIYDLIDIFDKQNNIPISQTAKNLYIQIFNKIEYVNLYDYKHSYSNNENDNLFIHIFQKLYSHMEKNKILKISDNFSGDYLYKDLMMKYEFIQRDIDWEMSSQKNRARQKPRELIEFHSQEEHSINLVRRLEYYRENLIMGEVKYRK